MVTAPEFVGVTGKYLGAGLTITGATMPAASAVQTGGGPNDWLFAFCSAGNVASTYTSAGWTSLGAASGMAILGRSDGYTGTSSFTRVNNTGGFQVIIARYSRVLSVTVAATFASATSTALSLPSVTPTIENSKIVQMIGRPALGASTLTKNATNNSGATVQSTGQVESSSYAIADEVRGATATGIRGWNQSSLGVFRGGHIVLNPIPDPVGMPAKLWNGSAEIPYNLFRWNGSAEVPHVFSEVAT